MFYSIARKNPYIGSGNGLFFCSGYGPAKGIADVFCQRDAMEKRFI